MIVHNDRAGIKPRPLSFLLAARFRSERFRSVSGAGRGAIRSGESWCWNQCARVFRRSDWRSWEGSIAFLYRVQSSVFRGSDSLLLLAPIAFFCGIRSRLYRTRSPVFRGSDPPPLQAPIAFIYKVWSPSFTGSDRLPLQSQNVFAERLPHSD